MRWLTILLLSCASVALADEGALSREAVIGAITAIRPQLDACYQRYRLAGVATVDLTIAPSGTVTSAALAPPTHGWGDFASASPTGACIVRAVLTIRVPPFAGGPHRIDYPIVLRAPAAAPATGPAATGAADRAQQAYVAGRFADAIALARQAVADDPQPAWRVIGASSCFLRDAQQATAAWQQLDAAGRRFIEYVCARHQVPLAPR